MKVYMLYTGGTIGCVGEPLAPMSGPSFTEAFQDVIAPMVATEYPDIKIDIFSFENTLDSTNMQPSEWVKMAERILENYESYDAFLILHGTDTMAWTASSLSFLLPGLSKPVFVSGSQLPLFKESGDSFQLLYNTDAVRNVLGAISFFRFEIPEVCLYFADSLFRGNRTVKSNSTSFVAFSSPNYPKLGTFGALPKLYSEFILPIPSKASSISEKCNLHEVVQQIELIKKFISHRSVLQIQTFPGYYSSNDGERSMFSSMINLLRSVKPKLAGVIFESYGIGNIPSFSSMQNTLKEMHSDGNVLVDCTQVYAGTVDYNTYAAGSWLKGVGVISGQDMTSIAAMTKLTVLIAKSEMNVDQNEVEKAFGTVLAGEMGLYYGLSGYQNEFLLPGESRFSVNGQYQLENTTEGYIKLKDLNADTPQVLAQVGDGRVGRLKMRSNNNLVFYAEDKSIIWESDTSNPDFTTYLKVADDGSLKLIKLGTDEVYKYIYLKKDDEKKFSGKSYISAMKKWMNEH